MQTVTVIFGKSRHPAGYLIRAFTWSRWTHCALVVGDEVYEAMHPAGVVVTPLEQFKSRYGQGRWAVAQVPCVDPAECIKRAKEQLGKPYDLFGVIGLGLRQRRWDSGQRWWCSELLAHCINAFRPDRISRVTPEHLWMISRP